MIKFIIILLAVLISNSHLLFSDCNIVNEFGKFVTAELNSYEGTLYLRTEIKVVDDDFPYVDIIRSNSGYFDYLLTNFSMVYPSENLSEKMDSATIRSQYLEYLRSDTIFTPLMCEFYNKSIVRSHSKDTINLSKLMNIAVKFFTLMDIDANGNFVAKICTGMNALSSTESNRNPHLEAFCFSSIIKDFMEPKANLGSIFENSIRDLYKINWGTDKNEKLLRAEGALFMLMSKNEKFINYLIGEYNTKSEMLPFVLKL